MAAGAGRAGSRVVHAGDGALRGGDADRGAGATRGPAVDGTGDLKKSRDLEPRSVTDERAMIAALHALEPAWSVRQLCRTLVIPRSSISYTPREADDLAL